MPPALSSDVIDYLLTSLSDAGTLLSTILVSKSFYQVFQARPSSTLASVAANQIGPELLPSAIRLVHFNRDEYLASRIKYVHNFPSEKRFSYNEPPVVASHFTALAKNDNVVTELEIFFSTTCKDRTSEQRSLLSPCESLRFRRALYRWWLMQYLFPVCYFRPGRTAGGNADEDGSDTEDDDGDENENDTGDDSDNDGAVTDPPDVYHTKAQHLRKDFLSEFPDGEVAEMWQVNNFMAFASNCARTALQTSPMNDAILWWSGPAPVAEVLRTLQSFNEPTLPPGDLNDWDYNYLDANWPGFIDYLVEKNYDTSKVGATFLDPTPDNNVILDGKIEDTEECDECNVSHLGPNLWSSSNWHLLPCVITFAEVLNGLPGHLGWNNYETAPLRIVDWSFVTFVNRHIQSEAPDWSEGKFLCKPCVLKLMGQHALSSLREIKAQQGPSPEDCWYGYRCRTQRRPNHAAKLNHLCEPTRGD